MALARCPIRLMQLLVNQGSYGDGAACHRGAEVGTLPGRLTFRRADGGRVTRRISAHVSPVRDAMAWSILWIYPFLPWSKSLLLCILSGARGTDCDDCLLPFC